MSRKFKLLLIPHLFLVVAMIVVGTIVESIRATYPIIKGSIVSFKERAEKFYSKHFGISSKKLTIA